MFCFSNFFKLRKLNLCANYCTSKNIKYSPRTFTGIQPTGVLHIGNYFGAVKKIVEMQNAGRNVLCSIADLHSITVPYDARKLPSNIFLLTASLLACGIDPERSILFLQSQVCEHTQLSWVLSCLTTLPKLAQLPQYREKSELLKDVPSGLYLYPVLQAADILLYKATEVPVGDDQLQHLQLSAFLARKFNKVYGETFPIPRPIVSGDAGCRVKNLRNPMLKMSKSHPDIRSRIEITDPPEVITTKCKKALTDLTSQVTYDPEHRPGVSNLISIHSICTGISVQQICEQATKLDTAQYKLELAEVLIETLNPIRKEIEKLLNNKVYLAYVLENGATKASTVASETWREVRTKIGTNHYI